MAPPDVQPKVPAPASTTIPAAHPLIFPAILIRIVNTIMPTTIESPKNSPAMPPVSPSATGDRPDIGTKPKIPPAKAVIINPTKIAKVTRPVMPTAFSNPCLILLNMNEATMMAQLSEPKKTENIPEFKIGPMVEPAIAATKSSAATTKTIVITVIQIAQLGCTPSRAL